MTLIDTMMKAIPSTLASAAASKLGESEGAISKAMGGLIPTILSGMAGKAATESGLGGLFSSLTKDGNAGFLDDLGGLIGGGNLAQGDPRDVAGNLMGSIFGDKVGPILGGLASFAGLKSRGSSSSILGVIGPMIMGVLAKKIKGDGLNAAGLKQLLLGEKSKYDAAVPSDIAPLLGIKSAARPAAAATTAAAATHVGEKKGMGLLWPILGLLGVGLLAWMCSRGGDKVDDVAKVDVPVVEEVAPVIEEVAPVVEEVAPVVDTTLDATTSMIDEGAAALGGFSRQIGDFNLVGNADGVESRLISFIDSDREACTDPDCWYTFDALTFQTSSADLDLDKSAAQIQNIHQILQAYPNIQLKLGGYTDNTGSEEFNMTLSQKRAEAVAAAVAALGTDASRLVSEGYGSQFPVASNETEEGRAMNRRIDVRVRQR